jgi:hypothetical protein
MALRFLQSSLFVGTKSIKPPSHLHSSSEPRSSEAKVLIQCKNSAKKDKTMQTKPSTEGQGCAM